jgi:succinate dehydrogenase / fumarate reductase membrane anchor subunit
MNMRTPLSRVRGLGPANHGTEHFWRQRLTSLASLVLSAFLIVLALSLVGEPYDVVAARLGSPFIAVPLIATVIAFAYHMQIGMEVIIEDYVFGEAQRLGALIANNFFCIAIALIGVFAILKLSIGG